MRDRQPWLPNQFLLTQSVLKKYPSRISKLRVSYSHKQQTCVQAFSFTRQFFVSQTSHAKKKRKSQLCIQVPVSSVSAEGHITCQGRITWAPTYENHNNTSWQTLARTLLARRTAAQWSWYHAIFLLEGQVFARKIFCYPLFHRTTSENI